METGGILAGLALVISAIGGLVSGWNAHQLAKQKLTNDGLKEIGAKNAVTLARVDAGITEVKVAAAAMPERVVAATNGIGAAVIAKATESATGVLAEAAATAKEILDTAAHAAAAVLRDAAGAASTPVRPPATKRVTRRKAAR